MNGSQALTEEEIDDINTFIEQLRKVEREHPKPEDVKRLRAMLRRNDTFWQLAGDLTQQAQRSALANVNWGKSRTLVRESVEAGMEQIRRDLGYSTAPALERLLIEQVVTAWLRLGICELEYSQIHNGSLSLAKATYWNHALESAQRRYLRAIESLARVRRLKVPALQVNVAQPGARQMNVATAGPVSGSLQRRKEGE
jgi:hypothetical protein